MSTLHQTKYSTLTYHNAWRNELWSWGDFSTHTTKIYRTHTRDLGSQQDWLLLIFHFYRFDIQQLYMGREFTFCALLNLILNSRNKHHLSSVAQSLNTSNLYAQSQLYGQIHLRHDQALLIVMATGLPKRSLLWRELLVIDKLRIHLYAHLLIFITGFTHLNLFSMA